MIIRASLDDRSNHKGDVMWEVIKYNEARQLIESWFKGLPHAHSTLIKSIVSLADPSTGIVKNTSYSELSLILAINPAPGRKDSGTPSKQTIRNYIKSIERECGDYFKVISKGQNLQFLFPELPKVFSEIFGNKEINTDVTLSETVTHSELNNDSIKQVNSEVNIEPNTPINAVKNIIYINNKTNNNNKSDEKTIGNKNTPKTISQDFYPSQETITRAIAAGHHNVTDANIIQEFIDKNTAWGSAFADFNPVYLSFLARHAERAAIKKTTTSNPITRSSNSERAPHKINSYDSALEAVRRHNQNACKPSDDELFPSHKVIGIERPARLMALDGINQDLRPTLSY